MTVDEQVVGFLRASKRKGFCDRCLASRVKRPDGKPINRYQAANATRPLRGSSEFQQGPGVCTLCGKSLKKITQAV
jgi:hypothetical protein